tara:strand:- start:16745 stop:17071 length:327 start_codon:yes stop_codon:yes gene_type:complete
MPYFGKQNFDATANAKISKYSFTVSTSTQQNFSIVTGSGDEVSVYLNGVLLQDGVDYSVSTTQVSLTSNAVQNDIVDVHVYQSFAVADAVSEATAKATSISSAIALGG